MTSPNLIRAVHRGAGSYSIMRGDEPLEAVEKLTKEDAAAFNAMSDEDRAAYVATAAEPPAPALPDIEAPVPVPEPTKRNAAPVAEEGDGKLPAGFWIKTVTGAHSARWQLFSGDEHGDHEMVGDFDSEAEARKATGRRKAST